MNSKDNNSIKPFTRQQKEIERKCKATEDQNIIDKSRVKIKIKEQLPISKEKQLRFKNLEVWRSKRKLQEEFEQEALKVNKEKIKVKHHSQN